MTVKNHAVMVCLSPHLLPMYSILALKCCLYPLALGCVFPPQPGKLPPPRVLILQVFPPKGVMLPPPHVYRLGPSHVFPPQPVTLLCFQLLRTNPGLHSLSLLLTLNFYSLSRIYPIFLGSILYLPFILLVS